MSLQSAIDTARVSGEWLELSGRHTLEQRLELRDGVTRLVGRGAVRIDGGARKGAGPMHVNGRLVVAGGLVLDGSYTSTVEGRLVVREAMVGLHALGAQSMQLGTLQAKACDVGVVLDGTGGTTIREVAIDDCGDGLVVLGQDSAGGVAIGYLRVEHTPRALEIDCRGMVAVGAGHIEGGRIVIRGGDVRLRNLRMVLGGSAACVVVEDCEQVILDGLHVESPEQLASWVQVPEHLQRRVHLRDCTYPLRGPGHAPGARAPLELRA